MKRMIVIALLAGAVVLGGSYVNKTFNFGNTIYEKQTVEVEKIVEVDTLDKMIKEAQGAKSEQIKTSGEQARKDAETKMLEAIELEVRTAYGRELDAKELELKKKQASFWREASNIKTLIREKADKYKVSATAMMAIVNCESQFDPTIQSRHTYHERNVPKGYQVGDREQSFGLVQIHLPAHPTVTKAQAIDPEFATEFLAKNIKAGRIGMWSCAKDLAMI